MSFEFKATLSCITLAALMLCAQTTMAASVQPRHDDAVRRTTDFNGGHKLETSNPPMMRRIALLNRAELGASQKFPAGWVVYGAYTNRARYALNVSLGPLDARSSAGKASGAGQAVAVGVVNGVVVNSPTFEVGPGDSYGWMVHGPYHVSAWVSGVFDDKNPLSPELRTPDFSDLGLPIAPVFAISSVTECTVVQDEQNAWSFFDLLKPVIGFGSPGTDQASCGLYDVPPPPSTDKCKGRLGSSDCPTGFGGDGGSGNGNGS
jgi:hypothetical protein